MWTLLLSDHQEGRGIERAVRKTAFQESIEQQEAAAADHSQRADQTNCKHLPGKEADAWRWNAGGMRKGLTELTEWSTRWPRGLVLCNLPDPSGSNGIRPA